MWGSLQHALVMCLHTHSILIGTIYVGITSVRRSYAYTLIMLCNISSIAKGQTDS